MKQTILILATCVTSSWAASDVPEVTVRPAARPPVIDGRFDDDAWADAGVLTGFRERRSGEIAQPQTLLRMTYDDQALYFAVQCDEPQPAGIVVGASGDDEKKIWQDDCVSIVIDPDPGNDTYYQFAFTPGGFTFDQKNTLTTQLYEGYEPEWQVRAAIGADRWTAEVAIPLAAMELEPRMGRAWRMNVFRVRSQAKREKVTFWSRSAEAHNRHRWGKVDGLVIGARSAAGLRLTGIDLGAGCGGENVFAAELHGPKPDGPLQVKLAVRSPAGREQMYESAADTTRIAARYRLAPREGEHRLTLTIATADGKTIYQSPPATILLAGLIDSFIERSYYTSEGAARIVCLAPMLDAETLTRASLRVALRGTDVVSESPAPLTARTVVDLPLVNVPSGDYTVDVTLTDGDGRQLASQALDLRKLPPGAGSEVKIVRRDHSAYVMVNGKPFFMAGTDLHGYIGDGVALVEEVAAAGMNMLCLSGSQFYDTEEGLQRTQRMLDAGARHGVFLVLSPEGMYHRSRRHFWRELLLLAEKYPEPSPKDPSEAKQARAHLDAVLDKMRRFKDHPALLHWRGLDEVYGKYNPGDAYLEHLCHRVDPYHPVERVFGPGRIYERRGDIYIVHRYLHTSRPMRTPVENGRVNKPIADADRKPLHAFPAAFTSGSLRGLTYRETRCQLFLGLIGGWRGICWFRGRHDYLQCWNAVKETTGQAAAISLVLLEPDVPQNLTVEQPAHQPVYASLHLHKGQRWVLAANTRPDPIRPTILLPNLPEGTPIRVHFEDRTIDSANGRFTDDFGRYGVHVYQIME